MAASLPALPLLTTILGVLLAFSLVVLFCLATFFLLRDGRKFNLHHVNLWPTSSKYSRVEKTNVVKFEQEIAPRWLGEAQVTLVLPWVACGAAFGYAKLTNNPKLHPAWASLALPQLLRVKAWEAHDLADGKRRNALRKRDLGYYHADMVRDDGELVFEEGDESDCLCGIISAELLDLLKCKKVRLDATLSCLEVTDAISDGLACAAALLLGDYAQHRFVASWQGAVWPFGPLIAQLGPGLTTCLTLAYATWCQLGVSASNEVLFGADLAGASALAARVQAAQGGTDSTNAGRAQLLILVRSLAESCLQLVVQTSLIAAAGKGITSNTTLAFSVALSWLVLLKKWIESIAKPDFFACWIVVPGLGGLLAYIAFKLYFIDTCDSHEWGLSTGCVPL